MLCVRQIMAHSPWTFPSPRKRNRRKPRASLICPNTGSFCALSRWPLPPGSAVSGACGPPASRPSEAARAGQADGGPGTTPCRLQRILRSFSSPSAADWHPSNTRCRPEPPPASGPLAPRWLPPSAPAVVYQLQACVTRCPTINWKSGSTAICVL
jgi:hypothetical protein